MPYLLHSLEKVIDHLCSPFPSISNENQEKKIESYRKELRKQCLIFTRHLFEYSITCKSKKRLDIHVRLYQSRIIEWINHLDVLKHQNSNQFNHTYQSTIIYLIETLAFTQKHFQSSFDSNQKLPEVCYQKHRQNISKRILIIQQRFRYFKLQSHLITTITHPFNDFIAGKEIPYSFHDKYFLYAWLNHLELISKDKHTRDSLMQEIGQNLIKFNLNSETCIKYCIDFFTTNYTQYESKQEQIQNLKYYHKCVNQTYLLPHKGYHPQKDSLKTILSNWLMQEIGYVENTCHICENNAEASSAQVNTDDKININGSVADFAFFIKILMEVKAFNFKNKTALLRLFSKHFSTVKKKNISYKSFRTNFYTREPDSIDVIKNLILEMLKIVQKMKA